MFIAQLVKSEWVTYPPLKVIPNTSSGLVGYPDVYRESGETNNKWLVGSWKMEFSFWGPASLVSGFRTGSFFVFFLGGYIIHISSLLTREQTGKFLKRHSSAGANVTYLSEPICNIKKPTPAPLKHASRISKHKRASGMTMQSLSSQVSHNITSYSLILNVVGANCSRVPRRKQ